MALITTHILEFSVSDDKLGFDGSGLERHLASVTLLYSPVIFTKNERVGVLM